MKKIKDELFHHLQSFEIPNSTKLFEHVEIYEVRPSH